MQGTAVDAFFRNNSGGYSVGSLTTLLAFCTHLVRERVGVRHAN